MRPFIGWSATVVITLGRSRMGSSCPLLSSPTGNDPAFPKLAFLALSHTGGHGASFGSAITGSLLPEKAIRLSRNTVPPGSNCYWLPAREGLSGLEAPQFTTDIFSAKSRVRICKHFVNKLPSPAARRCNSFCFYGIAAAMGLRHTNGNIGVIISNIRPECFSFSLPLLQFQKRFLASSAKND